MSDEDHGTRAGSTAARTAAEQISTGEHRKSMPFYTDGEYDGVLVENDDDGLWVTIVGQPREWIGPRMLQALHAARAAAQPQPGESDRTVASNLGSLVVGALEGPNHENGLLSPDDIVRVHRAAAQALASFTRGQSASLESLERELAVVRRILDEDWTRGRVLPRMVGAEDQARVRALRAVLQVDPPAMEIQGPAKGDRFAGPPGEGL